MHRDNEVPILVAHLVDQVVAGDAGIIDQDVERAEPFGNLRHGAVDLGGLRDIAFQADRRHLMRGGDLFGRRFGTGAVEIGDRDRGAILGEPLRRRRADATGTARDQRDASFRPLGHVLILPIKSDANWLSTTGPATRNAPYLSSRRKPESTVPPFLPLTSGSRPSPGRRGC